MNNKAIIIAKQQQVLLSDFPQYESIKGQQFYGAVKVASNNPSKFVVSVDDDVAISEETFLSIYNKSNLRAGWIDITPSMFNLDVIRYHLISLQSRYINNDIDIIILTYGYDELEFVANGTQIVEQTGDLIRCWKQQTQQLTGFDIPVLIQTKRRKSLLSTEQEQKVDALLLNTLTHE